jgi:cytochrome P450
MFVERDREAHRIKRKLVSHAVTYRSMRSFEPVMSDQVEVYLKQVLEASKASQPVNMTEKARRLALDIVGLLSFGYNLDTQTREDNRFLIQGMHFANHFLNTQQHLPFLYNFRVFDFLNLLAYSPRAKFFGLLEKMMRTRMAQ